MEYIYLVRGHSSYYGDHFIDWDCKAFPSEAAANQFAASLSLAVNSLVEECNEANDSVLWAVAEVRQKYDPACNILDESGVRYDVVAIPFAA